MTTPRETIDSLCDRTDLGRDEILRLAEARRATAPDVAREVVGRWTVELSHHARSDDAGLVGRWTARIYRHGSGCYEGLRGVVPAAEWNNPEWAGFSDRDAARACAAEVISRLEAPRA